MSTSELLLRDKVQEGSRPATQGGYRFGQLSHNSFFTRHNPHPARVRHLKGLLDVPICSVNDDGYFASPRYSLHFPPNSFNNSKLKKWKGRLLAHPGNMQSPLQPINPITGAADPHALLPYREKAVPKIGMVPVTEAWRDELKRLTDQLGDPGLAKDMAKEWPPKEEERPRTTMYSQQTGRLIPPPSRAMSRGNSRRGHRLPYFSGLQHIAAAPDLENVVLTMLCQILKTEDVSAVQAWLCSAGDTEKTMVMEMIRAAMAGSGDQWQAFPVSSMLADQHTDQRTILPPINGAVRPPTGEINRLTLEDPAPPVTDTIPQGIQEEKEKDTSADPPTNETGKPPSAANKPPAVPATLPPSQEAVSEVGVTEHTGSPEPGQQGEMSGGGGEQLDPNAYSQNISHNTF